jgi:hypothetical protein
VRTLSPFDSGFTRICRETYALICRDVRSCQLAAVQ